MDTFSQAFYDAQSQVMSNLSAEVVTNHFLVPLQHAIEDGSRLLQGTSQQNSAMLDGALKGFLAEAHHAASFNIDVTRRGLDGFRSEVLDLRGPSALGSPDIRIHTPTGNLDIQSKMYATADKTADQLSNHAYQNMGKLAPSEQIDEIRAYSSDSAATYQSLSPQEAAAYRHTASTADSSIHAGGASSRPISSEELMRMAKETKEGRLNPSDHGYTIGDTLTAQDIANQALRGATAAAAVGFAVKVAPHVWNAIQNALEKGEFSKEDLMKVLREGGKGAVEGAIRGAVAGGLVTACKAGFLGSQLQSVDPIGIGAATAVGISAIRDAFLLANGEITGEEFADRTARNGVSATAGVIGAGIGQALIPIPVLGAIIGNIIGSMVGSLGYEGAKALFMKIVNQETQDAIRELGQEQIRLAESVLGLLSSIQVVGEGIQGLVMVQGDQVKHLAMAGANWTANSEALRKEIVDLRLKGLENTERAEAQQNRFKRML